MGYMKKNEAIGMSLREHGMAYGLLCQSTLLVSAPVPERERDRECDMSLGSPVITSIYSQALPRTILANSFVITGSCWDCKYCLTLIECRVRHCIG
jgi:hypothetical protein